MAIEKLLAFKEKISSQRFKVGIIILFLALFPMLFLSQLIYKIILSSIMVILFAYLVATAEEEYRNRIVKEQELEKLKSAYTDSDEQAKIIIKKDLELNRSQEELDKKIEGLYTLHELGRAISATFNLDELFKPLNQDLLNKLGFQKGFVLLNEPQSLKTILTIIAGFSLEQVETIKQKLIEEKILETIIKSGKAISVNKFEILDSLQKKLIQFIPLASFIIVPLPSKEETLGFILVGNETVYSPVTTGDVEILFILANQLAAAIENAQLYDQVIKSHQELELRIRERTKELASLNEQLVKMNRMKSDFVSNVSHELRTPLTSIKGYASILMEGKLGKVSEEQKIRLAKINKHTDTLTKLINDLLDIARIESGRVTMEIKPVLIKEILDTCIDIVTPQLKEANIGLFTDLSKARETVLADQHQLERVFINLLSNAIKFTPAHGKISIKAKDKKEIIEISVSDTGAGIASEDLPKLFEEFYRADHPINQEKKGTGLGLALVKRIIEAHKGKIWATSKIGEGTTFTFIIPNIIFKEEEK